MNHVLSLSQTEYDFLVRANQGALTIVVDGVPAKLTFVPDEIEAADGCDFDFGLEEYNEPGPEDTHAPRYFNADTLTGLACSYGWLSAATNSQLNLISTRAGSGASLEEIAAMIALLSPGHSTANIYEALTCFSVRNGFDY